MPRLRDHLLRGAAVLVLALALAVTGMVAGAASAHQIFGIGDEKDPTMFSDPLFKALDPQATRFVANWDVAMRPGPRRTALDNWYAGAIAAGVRPLLSFGGFEYKRIPTVAQFTAAFRAALARWPKVETWETWNEADHPTQLATFRHPAIAAKYALAMEHACPSCHVLPISLVLIDGPQYVDGWIREWEKAYGRAPQVWALSAYGDANDDNMKTITPFLHRHPSGKVWLTETAAWAHFTSLFPWNLQRQAAVVRWVFAPAVRFPDRITRLYWYEWLGSPYKQKGIGWDSGLIDGQTLLARPAYAEVLYWRRRMQP
jgi:hypothetical protein